ncbi:hypothetical protein [uncultured Mobiluncus sp.]|uniref:hypothetical protein n=1 Tax=uncultured Mobiluncus sp. TaxID=293425 RepID=UPI00262FA0BB|nr:hypothetical protein [uncultured Mobiluncus sp.]
MLIFNLLSLDCIKSNRGKIAQRLKPAGADCDIWSFARLCSGAAAFVTSEVLWLGSLPRLTGVARFVRSAPSRPAPHFSKPPPRPSNPPEHSRA